MIDKFLEKMFDDMREKMPLSWCEKVYYDFTYWRIYPIKKWLIDKYEILTKGYPVSDTWDLHNSLAKWMLPRLKEFKKQSLKICIPTFILGDDFIYKNCTDEEKDKLTNEWSKILDDMIYFFEIQTTGKYYDNDYDRKRFEYGKEMFFKYYEHLWT